jgi:hypothetical protein
MLSMQDADLDGCTCLVYMDHRLIGEVRRPSRASEYWTPCDVHGAQVSMPVRTVRAAAEVLAGA